MMFRNDLLGSADLDQLLASTREGRGGCLVLRPRSGAVKTALLEYAVARAGAMRSVGVSGAASETEFRFAALHQLLAPFLGGLDRIPLPQRHALRGALGLAHGPEPDRFLVGLAVLTLLTAAAGDQPLLIVVDDAQWIDQASAEVFAFVARRLAGKPIALVAASDAAGPPCAGEDVPSLPRQRSLRDRRCGLAAGPAPPPRTRPYALASRPRDGIVVPETDGVPAAGSMLRPGSAGLPAESAEADSELLTMARAVVGGLLDDDAEYAFATRWVRAERDRSRPEVLLLALTALAHVEVLAGRLPAAESALAEARQVAPDGRPSSTSAIRAGELTVLAWRGREDQMTSASVLLRDPMAGGLVHRSVIVSDLAAGRYPAALGRALDILHDDPLARGTPYILPDLVEAASRTGDRAAATAALQRLAERAVASGTPLAHGLLARSRALLTDGATADGLYREAFEFLDHTSRTPELARTRLLHGEWLRRQRRHRDARDHLMAAADMFEAMGMTAFVRRARVELEATGGRIGRRTAEMNNKLTPQEARIAHLVTDGLTNRAIATQLFISIHTVEYHLQKVFRKFRVTSRTQLTRALLTENAPAAIRERSRTAPDGRVA